MSLAPWPRVSPLLPTAFLSRTPPSCPYDEIVAFASASCALSSSYVGTLEDTAVTADAMLSLAEPAAGLEAEALASPRCLLPAGSSSNFEIGPDGVALLRCCGVKASSGGDGDR